MMYFNAINNAFQYNPQCNADMHIDHVFKSQYCTYPTYGSLPGPLQYLAGYYHINDGYLVDTKNK